MYRGRTSWTLWCKSCKLSAASTPSSPWKSPMALQPKLTLLRSMKTYENPPPSSKNSYKPHQRTEKCPKATPQIQGATPSAALATPPALYPSQVAPELASAAAPWRRAWPRRAWTEPGSAAGPAEAAGLRLEGPRFHGQRLIAWLKAQEWTRMGKTFGKMKLKSHMFGFHSWYMVYGWAQFTPELVSWKWQAKAQENSRKCFKRVL